MKKVKTEVELKNVIEEEIIPIAKKLGKNFTVEELINFEKESMCKLSEAELESVNGGISLKPLLLGGGLFVLTFFGAGVNTDNAELPILGNYEIKDVESVKERFGRDTIGLKNGEFYNLVRDSKYFLVDSSGNEYMYSIKGDNEIAILPFL